MLEKKITHFFLLNDESTKPFSGAENHLWDLLKALSLDCRVELLVGVGEVGPMINRRLDELKSEGVEVTIINRIEISSSKNKYIRMFGEFFTYYKQFKIRKDCILHLHLNTNIIPLAAIMAGHNNIFFSFHNDEPYFTKWNFRLLLKYLMNRFRHAIAITNHVKKYLVKNVGLPETKISVVHYGIKPPKKRNSIEIKMPAFDGFIHLGFVGRLTEQKNLFFFLDCIRELPQVSLVLIGNGPEKDKLQAYTSKLGLADRVYFYGYLDDVSSHIRKFDFLCLPSKWEGLGLVLIEAMYQKVPIIGSSAGAIPEILENGELGTIISPDNKEDAVKAISAIIHDLPLAIKKADKAYSFALQNYSVESMVKKTIQVYNLCVE